MSILILLVRLIHIFSGIFWAGSIFVFAGFIQPAAQATGPDSAKFMQRLLGGPWAVALTLAPPLTVLAGLTLYWIDSAGLRIEWIGSPSGIGFTVGGLVGLTAFFIGFFPLRRTSLKLTALNTEIHAAGRAPTREESSRAEAFQVQMTTYVLYTAICLAVAVAAMATSRYWGALF
ncbi:MAG: hypothetical protein ACM3S0_05055 [Acidobacteriota bacterium]